VRQCAAQGQAKATLVGDAARTWSAIVCPIMSKKSRVRYARPNFLSHVLNRVAQVRACGWWSTLSGGAQDRVLWKCAPYDVYNLVKA
jgi:hypothetical protein